MQFLLEAVLITSVASMSGLMLGLGAGLAIAGEWRVSERTLSSLVKKYVGDRPLPLRPGGRGKTKRRGRINDME